MLTLKKIHKIYKGRRKKVHAVNDVNLSFDKGEFVSILGLSGSGKTTLVSMIGGLEKPSSGQMIYNGVDTSTYSDNTWAAYRKSHIGFVFQDFNLIAHLTAKDNIIIAMSLSGFTDEEKDNRADELLELVDMTEHARHYPSQLSGGQQQRICIARALSNDPDTILADEPTGALDPKTSVQIMNILNDLAKKGRLVIMVTHNKYLAKDYSSRIVTIEGGCITSDTQEKHQTVSSTKTSEINKSALEFKSAVKIAINNLKVRKKSTLFALFSIVPSMLMVIVLYNFVFNLQSYQNDLEPIYHNITSEETVNFLSPLSTRDFSVKVKGTLARITTSKQISDHVRLLTAELFEPYSLDQLNEIKRLEEVKDIIPPSYFDVNIGEHAFILIGLLPEAYQDYQYDLTGNYYPKDSDQGLILSTEAASLLTENPFYLENTTIDFSVFSYNGIAMHPETTSSNEHEFTTTVLKVMDTHNKTSLMQNYYKGYIFAPIDYVNKMKEKFTAEDVTLVTYRLAGFLEEDIQTKYVPDGPKYLSDLLLPLRSKVQIQEDTKLYEVREYAKEIPSSNFMTKYTIISEDRLSDDAVLGLTSYGEVSPSQYDEFAINSAKRTDDFLNMLLLNSKIVIAIFALLPSILVALILFISIMLRTREIGILKSLGARKKDIIMIFTLESGILAAISGACAFILSFPVIIIGRYVVEKNYQLTHYLGSNPLDIQLMAILLSMFMMVLLITCLGILPGRKASKLQPRELLRHIN